MPTIYRYKGYTVEQVGDSHRIWFGPSGDGIALGHAQSRREARRWINLDRGLMTPVESGWIESIGYAPLSRKARVEAMSRGVAVTALRPGHGFIIVRLKSGKTTAYLCPSWTYGAAMRSKSKGKAYHRLIKPYPEVPVPAGLIE